MARRSSELTAKEIAFCEEYVKTYNASYAYLSAYGCKPDTANAAGWKLLSRPAIVEYIKKLQQALVERYADASAIILEELMNDIVYKDENGCHSSTWLRSVDLAQKQLGLQKLKADIQAENTVINVRIEE